jgi:hypothetical protein
MARPALRVVLCPATAAAMLLVDSSYCSAVVLLGANEPELQSGQAVVDDDYVQKWAVACTSEHLLYWQRTNGRSLQISRRRSDCATVGEC